jgi:N-acylneuraminate cytidylyltransferase
MVMRRIAIIPARGGSKRLPKKNIIDFMGKPMIAWTIEAALQSKLFNRILVSTDAQEIAEVSEHYGATVPFLRKTAKNDHSPVSLATCAALQQCFSELGERYDIVTQLMPNTPLRTAQDIRQAMDYFLNNSAPSQISCFRFGWMNPWWAVKLDAAGRSAPIFPGAQGKRSQDLPALYCPTGAIWIAKAEKLIEYQTFYCQDHVFHPMPWQSAVDIDDEDDLAIAKVVFLMQSRNP